MEERTGSLLEGTHGINPTAVSFGVTKNSYFFPTPSIAKQSLAIRGSSAEELSVGGEPHTVDKITVFLERKRGKERERDHTDFKKVRNAL